MTGETLVADPVGLSAAARRITEQAAAQRIPCKRPLGCPEPSGMAMARVCRAFDAYREAFADRLLAAAEEISRIADSYTGTDRGNGAALNNVAPVEQRSS